MLTPQSWVVPSLSTVGKPQHRFVAALEKNVPEHKRPSSAAKEKNEEQLRDPVVAQWVAHLDAHYLRWLLR